MTEEQRLAYGWSWPLPLKVTPRPALVPLTDQESAEMLTRAAMAYQRAHSEGATPEDYEDWQTAVATVRATGRELIVQQEDLEPDTEVVHTFDISYTGVITPTQNANQTQTKETGQALPPGVHQSPIDERGI